LDKKVTNNFGALRLLFASLVIFSHSPELIDGNASREILSGIFGTMTFGSLAVGGFFLISGYLITASFFNSSSIKSYFIKRILRIYPGFIVASLVSIFVFAPLSGGWELILKFNVSDWLKIPAKLITLNQPWVEGAFAGVRNPILNGSMWTIRYEFLCYISVVILALLGIGKKSYLIVLLAFIALYLNIQITQHDFIIDMPIHISAYHYSRFFIAFMIGGTIYYYREKIIWNRQISAICFVMLCLCLLNKYTAELGLYFFGGYLLFNFSLNYKNKFISKIGSKNDISYGVYLYAFPFQNLVIQYYPTISPWLLTIYTLIYGFIVGYLSWTMVERPFMQMKKLLS